PGRAARGGHPRARRAGARAGLRPHDALEHGPGAGHRGGRAGGACRQPAGAVMPARSVSYGVFVFLLVLAHFVLRLAIGLEWGTPDLLTVAALLGARRLSGAQAAGLGLVLGLLD